MNVEEWLKVFAQTELDQARYFPEYEHKMAASDGVFEVASRHSRFIALCTLASLAKRAEVREGEMGGRFAEIAALSNLLIQVGGIYEWLMWHPNTVRADIEGVGAVDTTIYGVWAVLRRLCREALAELSLSGRPQPFECLHSEVLGTATEED